jgi:hypothetical protein
MPEETIFEVGGKKQDTSVDVLVEDVAEVGISSATKDKWHWDEKDLSSLVEAKLSQMFEDQVFVQKKDAASNNVVLKTIEATHDGEAFLSRRRGKVFCTYNLKITVYWRGKLLVGNSEIGYGAGRFVLPEVSYENENPAEWAFESDFDRTGGFGACLNPQMKTRELTEYEQHLQDIAEAEIAPQVRSKVNELVGCLKDALVKAEKGEKVLVDAQSEPSAEKIKLDADAQARAEQYGRDLHLKMVGKKYFDFLKGENEDPADVSLSCCSIDDKDLEPVIQILKMPDRGHPIKHLDLSFNSLEDGGLQQLCAALGGGACPNLLTLKLNHNVKLSDKVSKQMLKGLSLLRKKVEVTIDPM